LLFLNGDGVRRINEDGAWVNDTNKKEETMILEETSVTIYCVLRKSHMKWPGVEFGHPPCKAIN